MIVRSWLQYPLLAAVVVVIPIAIFILFSMMAFGWEGCGPHGPDLNDIVSWHHAHVMDIYTLRNMFAEDRGVAFIKVDGSLPYDPFSNGEQRPPPLPQARINEYVASLSKVGAKVITRQELLGGVAILLYDEETGILGKGVYQSGVVCYPASLTYYKTNLRCQTQSLGDGWYAYRISPH